MTTTSRPERFTSLLTIGKITAFLRSGGVAKLGKATSSTSIEFSGDLRAAPGEYVVVVPLNGINQLYWRAALLSDLNKHVTLSIDGTNVSAAK